MDNSHIKRAVLDGWDGMSDSYQIEMSISLDDVHYGPLCPGERELRLLGNVEGKRVLELACGAAQNSIALAKWNARVTAVDFSPVQLAKARDLMLKESVGVDLLRADMENLGMFRDSFFDVVISSFGWEFAPDLRRCFRECQRVLKPGGILLVCTVHPLAAFEWDESECALIVNNYFDPPVEIWNETPMDPRSHAVTYFHTIEDMFTSLTSSGFQVDSIVEPYPMNIHAMTDDEKRKIPYGGKYWEGQYERLRKVPFSIVYRATRR